MTIPLPLVADTGARASRPAGWFERVVSTTSGRVGAGLLVVVLFLVIVGPVLHEHDPAEVAFGRSLESPSREHLLGTDQYGRDQVARLLDGGRRSLIAGGLVLGGVVTISLVAGLAAGLGGRLLDAAITRTIDVVLAIPSLVIALAIVGALGPGFWTLVVALVVAQWASMARLARSLVLAAVRRPDVLCARLAGIPSWRIALTHVLPGTIAQLLAVATLELGSVIVAIAGLSFLGLGVQPPQAEWGSMLSGARGVFTIAPWLLAGPTAALLMIVTAANLLGDSLRDALDPSTSTISRGTP